MTSTMDKLKDKLHIHPKENESHASEVQRESLDEELAAIPPEEREAYLREFEETERTGEPKKGSLIDRLIARGNKRTEEQLEKEQKEREALRSRGGTAN